MRPWWLRPLAAEPHEPSEEPTPAAPEPPAPRPEVDTPTPPPPAATPEPPPARRAPVGAEVRPPSRNPRQVDPEGEVAASARSGDSTRRGSSRSGAGSTAARPRGRATDESAESDDRSPTRRTRGRRGSGSTRRAAEEAPEFLAPQFLEALQASRPEYTGTIERNHPVNDERKIAMFCDLENIALGVRDSADVKKFDINLIIERLLEKGKIIVKRAYADWERYGEYKRPFHEAAIEMIDIPQKRYSGKNSADIKMVVDAMDLSYSKEHLDTFAIVSGDSDFSPLVSKLKENNKYVIGVGVKNSSSNLLIDNCDEFIYYEDVWRGAKQATKMAGTVADQKQGEAFALMFDAIQALQRENKDVLWGSMIKQTMQRKKPSFSDGYYGYGSFSELLEDAEAQKLVKLKKDQRSGTYVVTGFATARGR